MAKANPFRFSAKYQDDETELLYYGYRYYNASAGRWLSRDLVGEKGGLNLYAFTLNAPVAKIDVLGKYCMDPCGFIEATGQVPRDVRGITVCCGGKKYACAVNTTPFAGKAKEILRDCILEHEETHFSQVECPACNFWPTRPPFKIPVDPQLAECGAYRVTFACLQRAIENGACGGEPLCEAQLVIAQQEVQQIMRGRHQCNDIPQIPPERTW